MQSDLRRPQGRLDGTEGVETDMVGGNNGPKKMKVREVTQSMGVVVEKGQLACV